MAKYDNRGKIALWKPKAQNENSPALQGNVTAHRDIREGEELNIVLWENKSQNSRAPILTGKLQDQQSPQRTPRQQEHASDDHFTSDGDIPPWAR